MQAYLLHPLILPAISYSSILYNFLNQHYNMDCWIQYFSSQIYFVVMLLSNETLPTPASYEEVIAPAEKAGFAATAKHQFTAFFQSKGFDCMADAQQQLKAIYNKLTVRFSVSDARIASDQGHAICYLSFTPLNKQYKIAELNAPGSENTYTLL